MAKNRNNENVKNSNSTFSEYPPDVVIVNPTKEKKYLEKLDEAEELLKDIYQWLLCNDSLDGDSEEVYAFRVINEIASIKELINSYHKTQ